MTTRKELEAARDRLREQVSQWTDGAFFQITYRQPLVDLLALLDALLAQEPVATLEAKVSTLLARALTTGYGSTEAIYALANLARKPLFAAPPPDEARELMQLLVQRYDDYRGKGISSAPGWYQMVVDAIERIRAYLERAK